jgi:hypothetical protein
LPYKQQDKAQKYGNIKIRNTINLEQASVEIETLRRKKCF